MWITNRVCMSVALVSSSCHAAVDPWATTFVIADRGRSGHISVVTAETLAEPGRNAEERRAAAAEVHLPPQQPDQAPS